MEDTNPQGSVTVDDAASRIFGMLDPQQSQDQAQEVNEEVQAQEQETYETEEDEAGEEVQEQTQETPRYRVKVDGEELEVDLDELVKGYSRTSDYHKKTQTLAEQRKALEAERAKVEEAARLRDIYGQRLQVIEQMLQAQPEEDLSALRENDPIGYAVKMAEKMERDKQIAAIRAERESVMVRQQAEQQAFLKNHLSTEAERLKAAIPELADEVKGEVLRKEIKDFAKSVGFTEQELAQVYDHRAVVSLYKAMQYDKLTKSKSSTQKKVNEAPRTLRPGVSPSQADPNSEAMKKLSKQLKQTGRPRDAAKLFEKFL